MNSVTKRFKSIGNLAYIFGIALVVASLVTNLIPPRVASAHHPVLSGDVVCQQDGTQLITWTIGNSETTYLMEITAISVSSGTIDITTGTDVPVSPGTVTGHTSLPGDQTGNVTLSVTGFWDKPGTANDVTATRSTRVNLGGDCAAETPDYQLNLSHVYCYDGQDANLLGKVEIHFVLLNVPDGVTPGTLTYNYGTITPGPHTGNVWHYFDHLPSGTYNIQSASVEVDGVTVNLHNPGDYAGTYICGDEEDASASVSTGVCSWDEQNGSSTSVNISLTGASLTINGVTYDASTSINLPAGNYSYTWEALEGYTGSGSGTLVVGDCTPGKAEASILTGVCSWDEQNGSLTPVEITLTGASLTIDGLTYNSSASINLPAGNYPYTWDALDGYTGSGSGTLVVGDCTPGNADASILTGVCTWDSQSGSLTFVNINLTGASLTINGVTYNSSTEINLPPGNYPYTWEAVDGYTGSGSGEMNIAACVPPPVPETLVSCYSLENLAFSLSVNNSGPSGEIGYATDLDATIVSLGTLAYGESLDLPVPGNATTLYLYPEDREGGWGEAVQITLDKSQVRTCEQDPLSLNQVCSYVDLAQPFGWTVKNLNAFAVEITWQYGPDSSPSPISLAIGEEYSFATAAHPGEEMQVYVDGILLVSAEHDVCPGFQPLQLSTYCVGPATDTFGWSVFNPNAFVVDAEWRVNGTLLVGLLNIPAGSSVQFTTPISQGAIVQIYYGGVEQDNAAGVQNCQTPENPPENPPQYPPQVQIPVTSGTPVLIPVTGVADDLGNMAPAGLFSLGLGFFGLGTILHGISRRKFASMIEKQ